MVQKIICLGLVFLPTLIPGCALAEAEMAALPVYMCGTDLQEDACADLAWMTVASLGDDVNVLEPAGKAGLFSL